MIALLLICGPLIFSTVFLYLNLITHITCTLEYKNTFLGIYAQFFTDWLHNVNVWRQLFETITI